MLQEQVSGLEEEKSHVTSTFKARIKDRYNFTNCMLMVAYKLMII